MVSGGVAFSGTLGVMRTYLVAVAFIVGVGCGGVSLKEQGEECVASSECASGLVCDLGVSPSVCSGNVTADAIVIDAPPADAADPDAVVPIDGAEIDARVIDGAVIDAPVIDAPAIDAPPPIDAAIDAPPDA